MATIEEFGKTIKQKYPQYQNIDDKELGLKMIEKYPQYKDRVFDTDPQAQAQIAPQAGEKPTEGIFDAVKKGFSNIGQSIKTSGEAINPILESNANPFVKTMGVTGKLLKPFGTILGEAVMTPARVVGEVAENVSGVDVNEGVANKLGQAVKAGLNTETAQKIMEGYEKLKATSPEAAVAMGALIDITDFGTNSLGAGVAGKGAQVVGKAGKKVADVGVDVGVNAAKSAGKGVGKAGNYLAAQSYGFKPETVKTIIKNPELFTVKEMAKIDRDSIFNKVKSAVTKRMDDLSATGKEYDAIKQLPVNANVSDDTIRGILKSKGIDVANDGKIKVNLGSDIQLSKTDITGLQEVLALVKGKKSLNAKEVLNLRTRLSNLSAFGEGKTNASKLVAKEIRAKIDDIAKKEIPGLADLDAKFAPERQFLTKVKKEIFNADGTIKDNAVSKIANLTGKGKENALKRMEKVIPGITEDVNILKAIEDIEYAKGAKVGTYMRTGLGVGGGLAAGGPVGAIIGAIATSPQVGVSLLRAFGKAKGIGDDIINGMVKKMKSGVKLIGNEKKVMDDAVDTAAKKLARRAKNPKIGMTIDPITPMGDQQKETLNMLIKQYENAKDKVVKNRSQKAIQQFIESLKK